MKEAIDIIVYFAVVFVSYYIGRCSGLDEKEFKRLNKIGHNPPPIGEKPGFPGGNGYQPKLKYHDNSGLEIMRKPPSTGSGIK